MTRSQIQYILAVDRMRNFSKAADECFVTQSTLSAMVAKFEQQIGVVIFDRKSKPIGVKAEGEIVLNRIKSINREFEMLDEAVNQLKGIETGSLNIAAIPTVAPFIFPLVLNTIVQQYPSINFTIHELTTKKIIEEIVSGKIDLGIVAIPLDIKDIVEVSLYHEPFLLYDKREGEQTSNNQVNIKDIDFSKLLLLEEGHCFRNQVSKICNLSQIEKVHNSITYYSGSIESVKRMVDVNKGLTLLPYLSLGDMAPESRAATKYFEPPVPARDIGLIYHKNFVKSSLTKGIGRIIREAVAPLLANTNAVNVIAPF